MPKVMRCSLQKFQEGEDGLVANAVSMPRVISTTGQIFNVNTEVGGIQQRDVLYDGTRNFNDPNFDYVGRMVRLEKTPPFSGTPMDRHKYEEYIITEVVSDHQIRLRDARFEDEINIAGPFVEYIIYAAATFYAESANFPETHAEGGPVVHQSISIVDPPPASAPLERCPWLVTGWQNSETLVVSDWTGVLEEMSVGGPTLKWFLHDKRSYNLQDLTSMIYRFMSDTGWELTQDRGRHCPPDSWGGVTGSYQGRLRDKIFFSKGEEDKSAMYARIGFCNPDPITLYDTGGLSFGMWSIWDPNRTPSTNNSRGSGTGVVTAYRETGTSHDQSNDRHPDGQATTHWTHGIVWSDRWQGWGSGIWQGHNFQLPNPLGTIGGSLNIFDYFFYGDKDEIFLYVWRPNQGQAAMHFGFVKEVSQNPNVMKLKEDISAGELRWLNVGDYDPLDLGYKPGDWIQVAGQYLHEPPASQPWGYEKIESTQIVQFSTSGSDHLIQVNNLFRTYRAGALVGEEPQGIFISDIAKEGSGSSDSICYSNAAYHMHATHHDWDGFHGFSGILTTAPATGDLSPNYRGGRYGIWDYICRQPNNNQFRGKVRYLHGMTSVLGNNIFVKDQNGDYYFVWPYRMHSIGSPQSVLCIGPIPPHQAKVG